jgi:predicted nucleic acid-binding protein
VRNIGHRLFLDTSYVLALLNEEDEHHREADLVWPFVRAATEVWVTEPVLMEVGNALGAQRRLRAAAFIHECYDHRNIRVVSVDTRLFEAGLSLYQRRPDKTWGLTDCISFIVMGEQGVTEALTADRHFVQAGFRALLRET